MEKYLIWGAIIATVTLISVIVIYIKVNTKVMTKEQAAYLVSPVDMKCPCCGVRIVRDESGMLVTREEELD